MQLVLDAVRLWMQKQGYAVDQPFPEGDKIKTLGTMAETLREVGGRCMTNAASKNGMTASRKLRYLRLGLIVEELAELFEAFGEGDEVLTLDALADLQYVIVGAAVAWDLPLGTAFAEVHLSNETKDVSDGKEQRAIKGENYREPRIVEALRKWREAGTPIQRRGQSQNIMEAMRRAINQQWLDTEKRYLAEIDTLRSQLVEAQEKGGPI